MNKSLSHSVVSKCVVHRFPESTIRANTWRLRGAAVLSEKSPSCIVVETCEVSACFQLQVNDIRQQGLLEDREIA